jgi:hypothetical protein
VSVRPDQAVRGADLGTRRIGRSAAADVRLDWRGSALWPGAARAGLWICPHDAVWADLDHVVPHNQGGATACENLCCLCRRHHRLKTRARGWSFTVAPDGALAVTTPSGVTRTTYPPGPRKPDLPQPAPDDDPPPF